VLAEARRDADGRALRAREDESCDDATPERLRAFAEGVYHAEQEVRALASGNPPKAAPSGTDAVRKEGIRAATRDPSTPEER
jgi:hypothetical protein